MAAVKDAPARPRSAAWVRSVGVVLIALSLIPVAACVQVFGHWLPYELKRYEDYRAAEACVPRVPTRPWENCLRDVTFTVEDVENRVKHRRVTLSGGPFWNGDVAFGDPGPVLGRLTPGGQVTGTVWRGDVVLLGKGELRQSSSDEPRDEPQMTAAVGVFAGLLAVLGFWFGAVRLVRPRDREPVTWRGIGASALVTMGIVSFVVGYACLLAGLPWWMVPPAVVGVVACVVWPLYRHRRPGAVAAAPAR